MSKTARPVSASRLVLAQVMTPQDANVHGNVHGGNIMRLADTAAGVVSTRHSERNCVTASVDRFEFHAPVYVGNLVTLFASLNRVGRSSMEVGVRVEAEELRKGKKTHTNSCDFTMVALAENGRPVAVPRLLLETEEDRRRFDGRRSAPPDGVGRGDRSGDAGIASGPACSGIYLTLAEKKTSRKRADEH